jgi:hypothetical protein
VPRQRKQQLCGRGGAGQQQQQPRRRTVAWGDSISCGSIDSPQVSRTWRC